MVTDDLVALAQYFVDCKYVSHSDERQRAMGLAYVEAERQDLAREVANFAGSQISRLTAENERLRKALEVAEDVLSRYPLSTEIWPNGMHPQTGIDLIRDALKQEVQ